MAEHDRFLEKLGPHYPWLVFPRCEDHQSRTTFCSMSQPFNTYGKGTSKFRIRKILGHSHGWLIVSRKTIKKSATWREFLLLLNPVSSESIDLPPLDLKPDQEISTASLLSPPGNPSSLVLVLQRKVVSFTFCKIGDKIWTKMPAKKMDNELQITDDEDSDCHWYLHWSPVNLRINEITKGGINFDNVLDIEISSLDFTTMEWIQLKNPKNRAFFFSDNTPYALSCAANESGIAGGFVYFTLGTDKILYSFNIEDKSISVSLPWMNPPPRSAPFWFVPNLLKPPCITNPKTKIDPIVQKADRFSSHKNEAEVRNLCDLPIDIIGLIAENLYLVDYMNFRSVCKTFKLVAPHIQWNETSFKLQSHSLPPWLMFADQNRSLHTFIDPNLGGKYLMGIPQCMIDFDIRYSKEGWLLMPSKVVDESMFLYNPFANEPISLPPNANWETCHSFGFSSLPTSPGCIIVGISLFTVTFLRLGDEEWQGIWRDDYGNFTTNHNSPVFFDGAFYFLGREGKLGVFSFYESYEDDGVWTEWEWDVLEKPRKPCKSFGHNYLLECDGKLFSVFVDNLGESVGIFELNKTAMCWRKVRDLGNYIFFVSASSSFSMAAKIPGMENKIYFPKIKGEEIVYYCLRTGKYRTFGSKKVAANFNNTKEYLYSCWIQQTWR
ncbi:hypothetical protein DITRI_Ditri14bG0135400 [Diplodiscus trichospermus]